MKERDKTILNIVSIICLFTGVLFLLYFIIITSYAGLRTSFGWFWSMGGIGLLATYIVIKLLIKYQIKIPSFIAIPIITIVLMGVVIFAALESVIIYHSFVKPEKNADYMIVLGAQVRGDRITKSLKARLDTAADYLKENENTIVILSGGRGPGENITEARAMHGYLINKGIKEESLIMEEQSTNTFENIKYSKEYMNGSHNKVIIVSNGFHIYRAVGVAKKQNIGDVSGLSAPSDPILRISYYVREVLAVIKDKMLGNI